MYKVRLIFFKIFILMIVGVRILCAQDEYVSFVSKNSFQITIKNRDYAFTESKYGKFVVRDYIDFTDESKSGKYKLPSRDLIVAIPPHSVPKVSLNSFTEKKIWNVIPSINLKLEMIDDSTFLIKEFTHREKISEELDKQTIEIKGYFWLREFYCIHIKIHTHKFEERESVLTELNDIVLNLEFDSQSNFTHNSPIIIRSKFDRHLKDLLANFQMAEQFRMVPRINALDSTDSWINYSATYVKLGTFNDGVYRISKSDLENFGIVTNGINPKTFQLFESGIEYPIYVKGENDLSFDENDYIEFYGTKNYSKISARIINPYLPYNDYLNKYSDTTIYFLTWNTLNGLRTEEINIYNSAVTDSINYYTFFNHLEENPFDVLFYTFHDDLVTSQLPFWNAGKGWYWKWLASWSQPSFNFNANEIVQDKMAKFSSKLSSWGSSGSLNVHSLKFLVNNNVIDSQVTNRFHTVLLEGVISSDSIKNGSNTLKFTYADAGGASYGNLLLDWIEIEYPKKLIFNDSSLFFQYSDVTTTALKKIIIENVLDSNIQLYKIKPIIKRITNYRLENGSLLFTDSLANNDAYFITKTSNALLKPIFLNFRKFINLRNDTSQLDYIAITNPTFNNEVLDYLSVISQKFHVTTKLISVDDIFDEFGYGYPTSESIREFVIQKFQLSPIPKPSYLVFFGDANYDFKHYRLISQGIKGGENYVPSFGFPVSDQYFAVWDTSGFYLPQMYVGRIPINTGAEMQFYKNKVLNNLSTPFDHWNKKFLFFSGGRSDQPSEILSYKLVNDSVINNFVKPPPIGGVYKHFYKTSNPSTDFGPYPEYEIRQFIDAGGVFISYIGHSGTATWDNSISDVRQLKNNINRNPLISDFGCSTNKFAEPDIVSFGERFLLEPDGQAIGYIGNTALGFSSTALKAPGYFYKNVIQDSIYQIGAAHFKTKHSMFQSLGSSNVVSVFSLTNTLMGDPILELRLPDKPNLSIAQENVQFESQIIDDRAESQLVRVNYKNTGTVVDDSTFIRISHHYRDSIIALAEFKKLLPYYDDSLKIYLQTKARPGQHILKIELDSDNSLMEMNELDNILSIPMNVASSNLRDLLSHKNENPLIDSLILIPPVYKTKSTDSIEIEISDNPDFIGTYPSKQPFDIFGFKVNFTTPASFKRSWLRYKFSSEHEWSTPISYSNVTASKFLIEDKTSFENQSLVNLNYFSDTLRIANDSVEISIISAGGYSGQYCIITRNGINVLSNTFFQGIGIAVFDAVTLTLDTAAYFELFNNPGGAAAFSQFVDSISPSKFVALGVAGDAKNNNYSNVRDAVLSLGGSRFPSLKFKAPYALIGRKGTDSTQVKQAIKNPTEGPVYLDTSNVIPFSSGSLLSNQIGPASRWKRLIVDYSTPDSLDLMFSILGIKLDNTIDTLDNFYASDGVRELSQISASEYPFIKLLSRLYSDSLLNSPKVISLGVDFIGLAELFLNSSAVSVSNDSIIFGEKNLLTFSIFNAGEARADSFNVNLEVTYPDNSRKILQTFFVDTLNSMSRKDFSYEYFADVAPNSRTFVLTIDPENKIPEFYEDNNIFQLPFFVKGDSSKPDLKLFFSDAEIFDGDYVSSTPQIKIEFYDPSLIPNTDTSSVRIFLDGKRIYNNSPDVTLQFNAANPKIVLNYLPQLNDGEHQLKIVGINVSKLDTLEISKNFIVSNSLQLLHLHNYPNPFSGETYFTFKLTQIPDEMKIKIFTVAGRLIKEISIPPSQLSYDFNKFYWDGRDADGDLLANGVYIYKVILKKSDRTETITQKLAIVR